MRTSLLALFVLCLAPAAYAQSPRLVVVAGDLFDVSSTEGADIVEESAWIVGDVGGFEVVRAYELEQWVSADSASMTRACGASLECHVDALFGTSIDYALVVSTISDQGRLVVHYELLDVQVGIQVGDEYAFLSSVTDFAALTGPCELALRRTPVTAPTAPAPEPAPVAVAPPPVATLPVAPPPSTGGPSPVLRAGRITAATGGALLFGGVLAGFSADEVQQQIQSEPHDRDELERLQSRGQSRQRLANAAFIVGAVTTATGVTLVIVDRASGTGADVAIRPALTGASVQIGF